MRTQPEVLTYHVRKADIFLVQSRVRLVKKRYKCLEKCHDYGLKKHWKLRAHNSVWEPTRRVYSHLILKKAEEK